MGFINSVLDKLLLIQTRGPLKKSPEKLARLIVIRALINENPDLTQMLFMAGILAGIVAAFIWLFSPFLAIILIVFGVYIYLNEKKTKKAV